MPTDPLDQLRLPAAPLEPRRGFAEDLRRRVISELAPLLPSHYQQEATAMTVNSDLVTAAPTFAVQRVETYLSVDDPRAAIDFYQRAFGATLLGQPITMPDGSIGHSELAIGDSVIRVAGEHLLEGVRSPASLGSTTVQLYVTVDDPDALFARAAAAGAEVLRPVTDAHGTRIGKLRDPFGHNWFVARS